MIRAAAALLLLGAAWAAGATTVMVMSLSPSRVELLVNGREVRSLYPGQTSPEGVRLVGISGDAAIVEVDGKRWQMRLGSATTSSVSLQADAQGHFVVEIRVNGRPLRALVDTGATTVSMNLADAQRLGIDLSRARRIMTQTAGGPRPAWLTRVASVQLGDILLQDVEASFSERNELPVVLLGMSFLNHVDLQRSGRTMTLTRRH